MASRNGGWTKHGKAGTPVYKAWQNLRVRCNYPGYINYANYGGRGIRYDPRWDSFEEFYKDMGDMPAPGYTLDRKDGDKDYCKDNCRWATASEQALNRRTTTSITYGGETRSMKEWSDHLGIPFPALRQRFRYGWTVEDCLTKPMRPTRYKPK